MNRRRHATLARTLIEACGGLQESSESCRVRKSQLADYQSPHGESFMPADVMAALEAHCGQPIYSRALTEALPAAQVARNLTEEACEAAEAAAGLQRCIRLAASDGVITPREREALGREFEAARAQLGEVGEALAREG